MDGVKVYASADARADGWAGGGRDGEVIGSPLAFEKVPLRGRALRYVLVGELMRHPERTVAELVARVAAEGYRLTGRASKTISDALRWEIRWGRVQRLGRGRYRYVRTSRSTARRIRRFAALCARYTAAARNRQPVPAVPRFDEVRYPGLRAPPHGSPPRESLHWLWAT